MVKPFRKPNKPAAAGKSPKGRSPAAKAVPSKPLNTSKGQFTFTMVTDGCYIEHKVSFSPPT
jgi:hypothetical protein